MKNVKIYKNNIEKLNYFNYIIIPTIDYSIIYNYTNNTKLSILGASYTLGYKLLKRVRKKVLYKK